MSRQHTAPILVPDGLESAVSLAQLAHASGTEGVSEAWIQNLVQAHPQCLPIAEIDPVFVGPVPICTELNTPAGPVDNLMITPGGLPVLIECKLWRNPEGRRQVVGQILDYAKELTRWSASDLQREVARRVPGEGNPILRIIRDAGHEIDEVAFTDALTLNLRRGRFLLLIVGDGIRESTEAIAEYLQRHLGLHFSLGLVELPIFHVPSGGYLVAPRVLARTAVIGRQVVNLPAGASLSDAEANEESDTERSALTTEQQRFWSEFLVGLRLDDPEQPIPRPPKQGYMAFMMPAPRGSSWITVWRDMSKGQVGLTLSWSNGDLGELAGKAILEEWAELRAELGGDAEILEIRGRTTVGEWRTVGNLALQTVRSEAFEWLRVRLNAWINTFRPRIRSFVADLSDETP